MNLVLDGRAVRVDFSTTQRAHSPTPGQYVPSPFSVAAESLTIVINFCRYMGRASSPVRRSGSGRDRNDRYDRYEPRRRSPGYGAPPYDSFSSLLCEQTAMIGTAIVIVGTTGKYLRVFRISHIAKGIATMINATTEIAGMTVTGAMIGSFIFAFFFFPVT